MTLVKEQRRLAIRKNLFVHRIINEWNKLGLCLGWKGQLIRGVTRVREGGEGRGGEGMGGEGRGGRNGGREGGRVGGREGGREGEREGERREGRDGGEG